ncbi:MAG: hypothetical protein AAFS07_19325, partial [Pseudomonadota bacterium]
MVVLQRLGGAEHCFRRMPASGCAARQPTGAAATAAATATATPAGRLFPFPRCPLSDLLAFGTRQFVRHIPKRFLARVRLLVALALEEALTMEGEDVAPAERLAHLAHMILATDNLYSEDMLE